jgi:hypothetical protein
MANSTSKWDTIPVGTRVVVTRPYRVPVTISGPDAYKQWVDWPAGASGVVINTSNAGFRGIEHTVRVDGTGDLVVGRPASDLAQIG